ncbi:cytochrome P450 4c3, partial [Caerostris darwini]
VIKDKKAEIIANRKLNPVVETAPDGSPMLRKKRKAFLELLYRYHLKDPTFTEEDIREEVDTFMFEGHDTTAMALSWTLYSLGSHPDIQKTAQEELDDIFEDDMERDIRREDLPRMKYLECVIKKYLIADTNYELAVMKYEFPDRNYELAVMKYEFPDRNYELAVMKYELPDMNYELAIIKYEFPDRNYELAVMKYELPDRNYDWLFEI